MLRRPLGRTGIEVSPLALGTVKFGRNTGVKYPQGFALPDDRTISNLLAEATELGINLIDTAPAYGTAESRLGQLLQHRDQWLICTKVGEEFDGTTSRFDFSPEHVRASIERSLTRLRTDYLDIVLIHSDGRDQDILEAGTLETLQGLKKQGVIRTVGISVKSARGFSAALAKGVDVVMATLNRDYRDEQPCIADAQAQGVGVLVKKALASGHAEPGDLSWVARQAGVSSIVVGTIDQHHLRANVAAV